MRTTLMVLHVVLAIFLIGPIATAINQGARALLGGDAGGLKLLARTTTIYGYASVLVALVGLALVREDYGNSWSDTWLLVSVALFVIATVLVLRVLAPLLRGAVATATAGGATRELAPRAAAVSGIASLCYVIIAVLMVWQPGN
jgi:uncharacterized membrane protein